MLGTGGGYLLGYCGVARYCPYTVRSGPSFRVQALGGYHIAQEELFQSVKNPRSTEWQFPGSCAAQNITRLKDWYGPIVSASP